MSSEDEQAHRREDSQGGGKEQHTPIIITDGSASIEFDDSEYTDITGGFESRDRVQISKVQIVDHRLQNSEHTCGPADPSQQHHVRVLCAGKDFDLKLTNQQKLQIKFDATEYPEVSAAPGRRKFRNGNRPIQGLEIRNSAGTVVHTCRLIPGHANFTIKIFDDHA